MYKQRTRYPHCPLSPSPSHLPHYTGIPPRASLFCPLTLVLLPSTFPLDPACLSLLSSFPLFSVRLVNTRETCRLHCRAADKRIPVRVRRGSVASPGRRIACATAVRGIATSSCDLAIASHRAGVADRGNTPRERIYLTDRPIYIRPRS